MAGRSDWIVSFSMWEKEIASRIVVTVPVATLAAALVPSMALCLFTLETRRKAIRKMGFVCVP